MKVYLSRLDGRMTEVLLYDPKILGSFVQLTGITMPDCMGSNPGGCIDLKEVLHSSRGKRMSLLPDKERTEDPIAGINLHQTAGLLVDENSPDLISFPPDPDGEVIKIDMFDGNSTEFRDSDTSRIDHPHD